MTDRKKLFFKKYEHLFTDSSLSLNERAIIANEDITAELTAFLKTSDKKRVIGVADNHTWSAAGDVYLKACKNAGIDCERYIFNEAAENLLPDEEAVDKIIEIGENGGVLFAALGSGTINDIVRYAAYKTGNRFISLPTAPSMDGYASSVSPLILDGIKTTLQAESAERIFIQPSILTSCPSFMVSAGIGDLAGKYCSILDWKLAHAVTGESYNIATAKMVVENRDEYFCNNSGSFFTEEAQFELLWNLIISGLSISLQKSSRPASGSEHHISHLLEMRALQGMGKHFLHGQTVGLGTWIILNIYAQLLPLSIDEIIKRFAAGENRKERLASAFGRLSARYITGWEKNKDKRLEISNKLKATPEYWDNFRISENFSPDFMSFIEDCFRKAGIGIKLSDYGYDKDEISNVVVSAKEIRDRFTILEFLDSIGCLEGVVENVVEEIF